MFVSHIFCVALGVIALDIFFPGWVSRSVALAASMAFMIYSGSFHPPGVFPFIYLILGNCIYTISYYLESISLKPVVAFSIKFDSVCCCNFNLMLVL